MTISVVEKTISEIGFQIETVEDLGVSPRGVKAQGKCNGKKKVIKLLRELSNSRRLNIMLHEMGHAMCEHSNLTHSQLSHPAREWEAEIFCEEILKYLNLPSQGMEYRFRYSSGEASIRTEVVEMAIKEFIKTLVAIQNRPKLIGPPQRKVA